MSTCRKCSSIQWPILRQLLMELRQRFVPSLKQFNVLWWIKGMCGGLSSFWVQYGIDIFGLCSSVFLVFVCLRWVLEVCDKLLFFDSLLWISMKCAYCVVIVLIFIYVFYSIFC